MIPCFIRGGALLSHIWQATKASPPTYLKILQQNPFLTTTLGRRHIYYYDPKTFNRGDFSFVHDASFARWLKHAFDIMESTPHAWDIVRALKPTESDYTMCYESYKDPVLKQAMEKMSEKDGHSGATMNAVIRHMWMISRLGWDDYVRSCITSIVEVNRASVLERIARNT